MRVSVIGCGNLGEARAAPTAKLGHDEQLLAHVRADRALGRP